MYKIIIVLHKTNQLNKNKNNDILFHWFKFNPLKLNENIDFFFFFYTYFIIFYNFMVQVKIIILNKIYIILLWFLELLITSWLNKKYIIKVVIIYLYRW
jgi:hypothetical protein